MGFAPEYGHTPIDGDELVALLPAAQDILGPSVTKAAVYDFEQAIQEQLTGTLFTSVLEGELTLPTLLDDSYLRGLHRLLYGDVWTWAGVFRSRELNIGVAPEAIAVSLRQSLENISHRWAHTEDWTPRELGIAVHAEAVRIHPFTDGNGRTTRLLAELVFLAAQDVEAVEMYDWRIDKGDYVALLRDYDIHRDPRALAEFIPTYVLK